MDFFDVLAWRRSVRAYAGTPVEEDLIQQLLEAINSAPSAGNLQAYDLVLVRDPERRRALARAAFGQQFIAQAPLVLVFLTNPERNRERYRQRGEQLYSLQDATIACTYAHLAATALGLASCWIGAFDEAAVHSIVGAPAGWRPVAMLPVGYPAEEPPARPRRLLEDGLHQEQVGR